MTSSPIGFPRLPDFSSCNRLRSLSLALLATSALALPAPLFAAATTDTPKKHATSSRGTKHPAALAKRPAQGATPAQALPAASHAKPRAQAAERTGSIEEVIVTSQKRRQSAQKTPISLSVWQGKELQTLGITNLEQLSAVAPDVNFQQNEGQAIITIRGISSQDVSQIGDPAVAIATDSVYTNRGFSFNNSFYDLDRIEIERGPQGTLSGRNAVGGAINIITAKPTDKQEANAKIEFGNYGTINSWAMVNQPITKKVQLRLAFNSSHNDGYRDLGAQGRGDGANNFSGRATLAFEPFRNFKGLISYQGSHMGGAGQAVYNIPYRFNAAGNLITSAPPTLPNSNPGALDIATAPTLSSMDNALRWNFEYKLPYVTLTYLGGYDATNYHERNDSSSNVSYSQLVESWNENLKPKTQNQEFRITSDQSYKFFWNTGFYFFREDDSLDSYDLTPSDIGWVQPLIFKYQTVARSLAWYAHGTYHILPTLRITGGIRYNWDKKSQVGDIFFPTSSALPYSYASSGVKEADSWTKATWHAGIEYDITPRNMAYFKVDTGYKPGGFTELNAYGPESVQSYELGFKNRFLHNHLQFNISGFWEEYTGQQVSQIISNASGGGSIIDNAGSSRIYGVDPNLLIRFPKIGEFNLDFQWLHARFRNFAVAVEQPTASGAEVTTMEQFAGNQLPQAPDYSVGAGFSRYWTVPSGRVLTQIKTRFQSSNYFYFTNTSDTKQKAYTNTTALAEYFPNKGHWHAQIFIRNLENSRIFTYAAENTYANAYAYSFAAPRTFGGSLAVDY